MNHPSRISRTLLCLTVCLSAGACSTRPRNFSATVVPSQQVASIPDSRALEDTFVTCNQLVRAGHKGNFASAAATSAAGTAGVVGGGALATTGIAGGSLATAGATALAAMPIVGFAAAFGMNRMIRSGREKKYKLAMSTCMKDMGYDVVDWTRIPKKQAATAVLGPTPVVPQPETARADGAGSAPIATDTTER